MITKFGSSAEMVIQPIEENGKTYQVAIDSNGLFITTQEKLDTMFADPNRYSNNRKDVTARLQALGLDPVKLASENQHLIKSVTADPKKKVNPLKASKRAMKK